jgi:hypothetical protein
MTNTILLTQDIIWGHFLFCAMLMGIYITLMEDIKLCPINYQYNDEYSPTQLLYYITINFCLYETTTCFEVL